MSQQPVAKVSNVSELIDQMLKGHRLSLARLISKVENRDRDLSEILNQLFPHTGGAQVWGITGPPGAGKSTLVDQMTAYLRKKGKRVAVVAIDPSSPFSGGAVLGDRIRMQNHTGDNGVFIRSLGTRGKQGGLSHATKEVVMVLDAAKFDVILVETAGVGQTELDILQLAQSVLVVLVPESGDSIQVMKAGLMEIADVFAVNKSDRTEADKMVRELISMVGLQTETKHLMDPLAEIPSAAQGTKWEIPVLKTEAVNNVGVEFLTEALIQHQDFLTRSGLRELKWKAYFKNEVLDILTEKLSETVNASFETKSGKELIQQMLSRKLSPYEAANLISGGP